jgi:uncharacterized protein YkwD
MAGRNLIANNGARLVAVAAASALAGAALPAAASAVPLAKSAQRCANADLVPTTANLAQVRSATLCLMNAERRARGLRRLKSNSRLRTAAQRYAEEMVRKDFFGHVSPSGTTVLQRIKKATYLSRVRSYAVGENLAWGTRQLSTPAQTMRGWMNSAPHRRNILDRGFREVGIGVAIGAPGTSDPGATYATDFGRRS